MKVKILFYKSYDYHFPGFLKARNICHLHHSKFNKNPFLGFQIKPIKLTICGKNSQ